MAGNHKTRVLRQYAARVHEKATVVAGNRKALHHGNRLFAGEFDRWKSEGAFRSLP